MTVLKYVDFTADILLQLSMLGHFMHVWNLYGVSFTLIDLFLFMNMRSVFVNLTNCVTTFRRYRQAIVEINSKLPDANPEELKENDKCAICLEKMKTAKRLPCRHHFHRGCLEHWIHQKRICPCCRAPFATERKPINMNEENSDGSSHAQNGSNRLPFPFYVQPLVFIQRVIAFALDIPRPLVGYGAEDQVSGVGSGPQGLIEILSEMFPHVPHQEILRQLEEAQTVRQAIENLLDHSPR
mmetsp:Transcript_20831/g.29114  ORF Transcript_20831/g.29114 Transcript_20831/m.29114 type:complete len:240 (-) Transcript_20831:357-1076(-)|eukprot:CAMPEP_0184477980 /NCGR_PEP_ID=MMETSP0113_2-20130426/107_1 /TAXON_ID=91329 /ORGANISM="Norrisiella sphaerica, Strain BC52" /LENGTH=239 /DNA_ID=CAMNT_0026855603 /DNA_START=808 /DNA_END=1527 /DNA_ORIENTATION=-